MQLRFLTFSGVVNPPADDSGVVMLNRPMTADEIRAALSAAARALAAVSMAYDMKIHSPGGEEAPGDSPPAVLPMERRTVESCILDAAPAAPNRPVTMKQLAKMAGYSYSDWFRREVDALVSAGELVRTSQGVRRAR